VILTVIRRGFCFLLPASAAPGAASSISPMMSSAMEGRGRVVVQTLTEEGRMDIAIPLSGKLRQLNRLSNEPLQKVFGRIKQAASRSTSTVGKRGFKAGGGEQVAQQKEVLCELFDPRGEKIYEDTLNIDAWKSGNVLKVGEEEFLVDVDPPSVQKLSLLSRPMSGIPLLPLVELRHSSLSACTWRWFRSRQVEDSVAGDGEKEEGENGWEPIADADCRVYTPRTEDVGWKLRVRCLPRKVGEGGGGDGGASAYREGEHKDAETTRAVAELPKSLAGDGRQESTRDRTCSPSFRVVSYNLLASSYADSPFAREKLFPYVPAAAMDADYRKQLQLLELFGYNADILCLQEVDQSAFQEFFEEQLDNAGYSCHFLNKAGSVKEGEAVCFRRERFEVLEKKEVVVKECFKSCFEDGSRHRQYCEMMSDPSNAELYRVLSEKLSTVAQVVALGPRDGAGEEGGLIIVNTHLFFHPEASHIRMLQVSAILTEAMDMKERMEERSQRACAVLFVGDLNSEPDTGAIELLAGGAVSPQHPEWEAHAGFRWGDNGEEEVGVHADSGPSVRREEGQALKGMSLSHPLALASSDGLGSSFTNYVRGYIGCLDYIFYEASALRVEQFVQPPTEEEVDTTALPSFKFPSDHISICCDLTWRKSPLPSSLPSSASLPSPFPTAQDLSVERYPASLYARTRLPQPASPYLVYKAVASLREGKLIGLPIDNEYYIAAASGSPEGVQRLREAQGGGGDLSVCLADPSEASEHAVCNRVPLDLLHHLLSLPATNVVLPRKKLEEAGDPKIVLRCPGQDKGQMYVSGAFSFPRAVARELGMPLVVAPASSSKSCLSVREFRDKWAACAQVFDGGDAEEATKLLTIDMAEEAKVKIRQEDPRAAELQELFSSYGITFDLV